jgi:hypothetical protein
MAIDIFNEPWDYTWSEWKSLAESAYQTISDVNNNVLIMVEGIGSELQDDTQIAHGDEASNPNWGENFYPAAAEPLNIPKERLILSPHTYGPSVFVQRQVIDPSQPECNGLEGNEAGDADCRILIDAETLKAGWDEHFGYLRDQGYGMIIGEFGGNLDWPEGASEAEKTRWDHITPGIDEEWQNALVDYAIEKNINGCYWSINPESSDTGGLYGTPYVPGSNESGWGTWTEIDSRKMDLLARLWDGVKPIDEGDSNKIEVRMRGVVGDESVSLLVDGNTLKTWTLGTSMTNYSHVTDASGEIRVAFTNDNGKRDVQVDYIIVNGERRQAEEQNDNSGAWSNGTCGGGSYSEWLHCNGSIGFGDISKSNKIEVHMRGVIGDESVNLQVGGNTLITWKLGKSMFTYSHVTDVNGEIRVVFTNDNGKHDVQVDYIDVNGERRQAEDQNDNSGAWGHGTCGGGSYSEWLHCNGSIGFGDVGG